MKKENVFGIGFIIFISFSLGYGSSLIMDGLMQPKTQMSALRHFEIVNSDFFDGTILTIKFHNLPKGYEYDLVYPESEDSCSNYVEWTENDTFTQSEVIIKVGKQSWDQSVYLIKLYKQHKFWDWCQIHIIDINDLI